MSQEIITLAEIKQGLRGIHRPFFSNWVFFAKNKGYLDPITEGLLQGGKITHPIEVLSYLADLIPEEVLRNTKKINYGDFQNSSTSKNLAKELSEELTGEKMQSAVIDKTTRYGSYGHLMAAQLFSGALIPEGVFITPIKGVRQLDFFSNEYAYEFLKQKAGVPEKKASRRLLVKLIEKIEKDWKELVRICGQGHLPIQTDRYKNLVKDLNLIYGEHVMKVLGFNIEDQYLSFLTIMTWVSVLLYYKKTGSFPLFNEVSVLENSSDVGVGRLDALAVVTIDGKKPNPIQIKKIRRLTKRFFPSIGHVIRALIKEFGVHLHLKIIDWKFAVGDGVNGMKKQVNLIYKKDVDLKPLEKHENQVKRYQSMSVISHSLATGFSKLHEIEEIWNTESFSLTGELVYFFPDQMPTVHEVVLTKEEIQSVFKDQIVSNFSSAKKRATLRIASNLAMSHVLQILHKNEEVIKSGGYSGILDFEGDHHRNDQPTIASIIRKYHVPVFQDPATQIIEVVGKRSDKEDLEMHVDKLFQAIESGLIKTSGFTASGGKICCPVHGEDTPSCSVAFDIGRFTCFGCGISGNFNLASIPQGVEISMGRSSQWELEKLVIPERHRDIMLCAQKILRGCFWDSPAETYLYLHRGLNPWLSYNILEAGYADDRLIKWLLGHGFSFEELYTYGFIDFAKSVREDSTTVVALKWAGIPLEKQRKLLDPKKGVWGLPYSVLEGRLTFPLEIHRVVNSFYGRSVNPNCPKHLRHRKLRSKETGMRHGGVLITSATESTGPILVVEAALNMATLIEIASDFKAHTAIVGANNPLLAELLAGHPGDIYLGLDYDPLKWDPVKNKWGGETGQRNTVILRDKLKEYGFKKNVYDFTGGLVKHNPEIIYNDANQYWLDYSKPISILDNLIEIPDVFVEPEARGVKIPG
jgi:hypothetical protein